MLTRLFALFAVCFGATVVASTPPNIVLIVTDDLGYGDAGCYGGEAIPTPQIDRMAEQGVRMTRCYAPASTCTPTRYGIMTAEYAWRQTTRRTSVLDGDAPLAIEPGRPTLPAVFRDAGYETALVGKWHLGIGDGETAVDFNGHVGPGPMEVGFDEAFYIPATVDRVPCVFIEGHRVAGLDPTDPIAISYTKKIGSEPTGVERPDLLRYRADKQHSGTIINRISRIGWMSGGRAAWWIDEEITDTLATRADEFIRRDRDKPFFLMLGTHDPHVPHAPHPRFEGKSDCGIRGDSIAQCDWLVGVVLDSLVRAGIDDETLVILTSDNGPTVYDGYFDGSRMKKGDHDAAGELRGGKYTVYEGGCRVPCVVRWPGTVEPGVSDAAFSLIDLLPSLATLAGIDSLPEGVGRDGRDRSQILVDSSASSDGAPLVLQGIRRTLALLHGDWKYVPANGKRPVNDAGRGANTQDGRFVETWFATDTLIDLAADPSERANVADAHPERVERMKRRLAQIKQGP